MYYVMCVVGGRGWGVFNSDFAPDSAKNALDNFIQDVGDDGGEPLNDSWVDTDDG